MSARMSLGRHPPPNPRPASRNCRPIRTSCPRASASTVTSAPAASQTLGDRVDERDLRRQERVRADLDQLGGRQVADDHGACPRRSDPRRPARSSASACGRRAAQDDAVGVQRVLHRLALAQELRVPHQLGAHARRAPRRPPASRSRAAVPTGTVDLPTMSPSWVRCRAMAVRRRLHVRRSAAWLVLDCGVPTQTKCTSAQPTASATSVVNRSRPVATCSARSSGRPGS